MHAYDFTPLVSKGYMRDSRGPTTAAFAGPLNALRFQMNELAADMNAIRNELRVIKELADAIKTKTAQRTTMVRR